VLGLTKLYRETNLLRPGEDLSNFIRRFNMESPLCDFIDAGDDKECADVKIKGQPPSQCLQLIANEDTGVFAEDFNNIHCQRIFFCASADSGYARVLGPHRGSQKISLVEGPAFPREMAELAATFDITSFSDVFMPTKLERPPRVISPPTQETPSPAIATAIAPASTPAAAPGPSSNYASAAKTAETAPVIAITPSKATTAPKTKAKPRFLVCLNARNQRDDSHIKTSSKEALAAIKRPNSATSTTCRGTAIIPRHTAAARMSMDPN
jgi:hypothetical protein